MSSPIGAVLTTAETQAQYDALLARRRGPGDAARARTLGALVEQVAAPRGPDGLLRAARMLRGG